MRLWAFGILDWMEGCTCSNCGGWINGGGLAAVELEIDGVEVKDGLGRLCTQCLEYKYPNAMEDLGRLSAIGIEGLRQKAG